MMKVVLLFQFPLLRPSGYRLFQRLKRLKHLEKELKLKDKSQKGAYAPSVMLATLSGPIGKTFASKEPDEGLDPFSSKFSSVPKDSQKAYGIKESKEDYVHGKWCYDTPGTVQPDQMINLLTHEELMKVLPRELIQPCTYSMKTGLTLFVGGLARLDLLYSCRAV
ncbi:nitric oxide associated protein 1, partial [Halocaridina rubra]